MLNTKKIKRRYFIFIVFYVLFGIALTSILKRELSPDFKQKYKIILFVIEVFFMNLPMLLALIINNYIAKKTGCILNPGHGKIPAPDFNFYIQKDKYPI